MWPAFQEIVSVLPEAMKCHLTALGSPFDLYFSGAENLADAGFPKPDREDIPSCDIPSGKPCTKEGMDAEVTPKRHDTKFIRIV